MRHRFPKASVLFTASAKDKIAYLVDDVAAADMMVGRGAVGQRSVHGSQPAESHRTTEEIFLTTFSDGELFDRLRSRHRFLNRSFRTGPRVLIDDLTRAHHLQTFEPQIELVSLLEKYGVPFIRFDTRNAQAMWMDIVRIFLS